MEKYGWAHKKEVDKGLAPDYTLCVSCVQNLFVFLIVFIFFKITVPLLFNEIVSMWMYYFYLPFCWFVLFLMVDR